MVETSKKRERDEQASDLPTSQMKRVSFGGLLCPELFDKCLPPNSPLCKGATPCRSASDANQSLLRRSSAIGSLQVRLGVELLESSFSTHVFVIIFKFFISNGSFAGQKGLTKIQVPFS